MVALGYGGNLLREYLTLAYPHRDIKFSEVTPYQGPGSGLGKTLLDSKHYLDAPFVFTSCDTLVKGTIPALDRNWIGYSNSDVLSPYRTIAIENNRVVEILEKGEGLDSSNFPYIGLCGIYNHELFWEIMSDRSSSVISAGESYGLRGLIPEVLVQSSLIGLIPAITSLCTIRVPYFTQMIHRIFLIRRTKLSGSSITVSLNSPRILFYQK